LAFHELGRSDESEARMAGLTEKWADTWAFGIARAHAFIGNKEAVLAWLETTMDQQPGALLGNTQSHFFQNLQSAPRWHALLENLGIADD
jgi:hypothetical protein